MGEAHAIRHGWNRDGECLDGANDFLNCHEITGGAGATGATKVGFLVGYPAGVAHNSPWMEGRLPDFIKSCTRQIAREEELVSNRKTGRAGVRNE